MMKAARTAYTQARDQVEAQEQRLGPTPEPGFTKSWIRYEDNHLIILNKPAGLLSQADSSKESNVVDCLRHYFGRNYVGLIHRLDRNTSGLMVVAKRTKSAQRLTRSLQEGQILRTYLAWLVGRLPEKVQWRHQVLKDSKTNTVRIVSSGGKECLLTASPIQTLKWKNTQLTLAEFILETGRSHQIRVQASYEGFPLLGDSKYQKGSSPSFPRLALHSHRLEFPHPMSGELLKFKEPLPKELDLG